MVEIAEPVEKHESNALNERVTEYGLAALSDAELLTLIAGESATATALIEAAGSIANLRRWSISRLAAVKGIGRGSAARIAAALALSTRTGVKMQLLDTPERIYEYMRPYALTLEVEKFWVLCLNRKNVLIKRVEVTSGTATSSLVHPREVFREAILQSASALVAVHNHPSGDPHPSSADIQVTRQLREASRTVGIDLLDHVIVGIPEADPARLGYYSFHESGLLTSTKTA